MLTLEQIENVCDRQGWSLYVSDRGDGRKDLEFEKYVGEQDFIFSLILNGDDTEGLIDDMEEYIDNFDVDEEASLWIGEDGHGKNGAPYRISDILEEMQMAKDEMQILYEILKERAGI